MLSGLLILFRTRHLLLTQETGFLNRTGFSPSAPLSPPDREPAPPRAQASLRVSSHPGLCPPHPQIVSIPMDVTPRVQAPSPTGKPFTPHRRVLGASVLSPSDPPPSRTGPWPHWALLSCRGTRSAPNPEVLQHPNLSGKGPLLLGCVGLTLAV